MEVNRDGQHANNPDLEEMVRADMYFETRRYYMSKYAVVSGQKVSLSVVDLTKKLSALSSVLCLLLKFCIFFFHSDNY